MITGKKQEGGNVVTTLNGAAQKAAYEGLGEQEGRRRRHRPAHRRDPGAGLHPLVRPLVVRRQLHGRRQKAWTKLQKKQNPDDPMLNRALRETYPPGSTFKVVTAAAALEHGWSRITDAKTDSPDPWTMPDTTTELPNEGNIPCKNATLREALQFSCNTVFGKLGSDLGKDKMLETAEKFGFNEEQFVPVRASASVFPDEHGPAADRAQLHRPVRHRHHPAADGHGRLGHRQRRHADEAVHGRPAPTAPNLDAVEQTEPEGDEPAALRGERPEPPVDDGDGRRGGHRHQGADPRTSRSAARPVPPSTARTTARTRTPGSSRTPRPTTAARRSPSPSSSRTARPNRDDISGGGLAAPIAKGVMKAVLDSKK